MSYILYYDRALGLLAAKMSSSPSQTTVSSTLTPEYSTPALTTLCEGLKQMLVRSSSTHRMVASLMIGYWGKCPEHLMSLLNSVLTERATYEEIMPFLAAMQRECHVRLLIIL